MSQCAGIHVLHSSPAYLNTLETLHNPGVWAGGGGSLHRLAALVNPILVACPLLMCRLGAMLYLLYCIQMFVIFKKSHIELSLSYAMSYRNILTIAGF